MAIIIQNTRNTQKNKKKDATPHIQLDFVVLWNKCVAHSASFSLIE